MTMIDDIMQVDIIDKLNTITVANGYTKDVSVLDGYYVHFARDLLAVEDGIGFPCVAAQPDSESVALGKSTTVANLTRIIKLIGAVNAIDKTKVNADLNQLVHDVREALVINKYDENSKANSISLGNVNFTLPDKQEQYAYFEMTIEINYIEKWI